MLCLEVLGCHDCGCQSRYVCVRLCVASFVFLVYTWYVASPLPQVDSQHVITFTGPGNQTFLVKKSSNLQDDFTTVAETEAEVITDAEGNGQAILTIPEEGLPGEFYRVESSP